MKALTISQPWASLIASGEKWVENRCWETAYRGPLLIHAGKGTQYLSREELLGYPTGAIVAIGYLSACVEYSELGDEFSGFVRGSWEQVREAGCGKTLGEITDHKYTEGPFCWVLEHVVQLDIPYSIRGAQGLWEFKGPPSDSLQKAAHLLGNSIPHGIAAKGW